MTTFTLTGVITDATLLFDDMHLDITDNGTIYKVRVKVGDAFHAGLTGTHLVPSSNYIMVTGSIEVGSDGDMQLWGTHFKTIWTNDTH